MVGHLDLYRICSNSERIEGVLVPNATLKSPVRTYVDRRKVGEMVVERRDLYDYSSFIIRTISLLIALSN